MIRLALLSTAILAGLAIAPEAQARGFGPGFELPTFEQLDADGNGEVTIEEMRAFRETAGTARFTQADTDGDGVLTVEELKASAQSRASDRVDHMVERLDSNGDGALSQEEMQAMRGGKGGDFMKKRGARMFDRLDTDNSGGLSAEEFAQAEDRMARRGFGMFGGGKRGPVTTD